MDTVHDIHYCSVIRRLISLIYQRAHLEADSVALKKQAEQANKELVRRMKEDEEKEVQYSCTCTYTCIQIYMYWCVYPCDYTCGMCVHTSTVLTTNMYSVHEKLVKIQ